MDDEISRYNRTRWAALVAADAVFTRPVLDLTPATAQAWVNPDGRWGDLHDQAVCCLATGGGQQGPAFALLGAQVTVVDLSPEQLAQDTRAARHYGVPLHTLVADMRDLHALPTAGFDLVWQAYALNFVPDARVVFEQVARLLRPQGYYHFHVANPFALGVQAGDWTGSGYPLRDPYRNGAQIPTSDPTWVYGTGAPDQPAIPPPREYRHTLTQLINGLTAAGFTLLALDDQIDAPADPTATPGTWAHFTAILPPWFALTARRNP